MKNNLTSQKEILPESISIRIDGGKLEKTADGKITMGKNPTILTWFGVVFCAMLAFGILALMISSMIKDISFFAQNFMGGVVGVGIFGYLAFRIYQQTQHGQVVIDPTAHKIKSLKREINYDAIESVLAHRRLLQPSSKNSATIVTFQAFIPNENPLLLGSISGDRKRTEEKAERIISLLEEAGFVVKKV